MTLLRRFAASATALRADQFIWARIKLTAAYLAMITAIVVILSSSVYSFHVLNVERLEHRLIDQIERQLFLVPVEQSYLHYLLDLRRAIILGDVSTIVIAGALSWILAGATLRPIRATLESQSRFFANAAHDLRTPLAVMRTEAEVALRKGSMGNAEAHRLIESSLEEVKRMSTMVEQMMILSRGQVTLRKGLTGSTGIEMDDVPLAQLVHSVASKMAIRAEERGVTLQMGELAAPKVRGNYDALERALYNVVENALSYTPAGGSVTIDLVQSGAHATLSVRDTGIGIAAEDLAHVTEPFFRADAARDSNTGGSGLGLTIVKDIIATQGGALSIDSTPGAGTSVHMRFIAL